MSASQAERLCHSTLNAFFTPHGVQRHFSAMAEAANGCRRLLSRFSDRACDVDLLNLGQRATLHTVLLAVFSHHSQLFEEGHGSTIDEAIISNTSIALDGCVKKVYYPKALNMLRREARWEAAVEHVRLRLTSLLKERRGAGRKDDILQQMIDAGIDLDNPKDISQTVDQLALLLLAGFETSGATLASALELLSKNDHAKMRVREEACHIHLNNGAQSSWSPEEVKTKLPYTERVILETMRLEPPATALIRIAREDIDVCASSNGKTYHIRKGDAVSIVLTGLHRNEKLWKDPECFRPDRHMPEEAEQRHAYAYLPFGAGARACLGRLFAMHELKLFVASITAQFDLTLVKQRRRKQLYGITMRTQGIFARASVPPRSLSSPRKSIATNADPQNEQRELVQKAEITVNPTAMPCDRIVLAYGSGLGDCRSMAFAYSQQLDRLSLNVEIMTLDEAVGVLSDPRDRVVLIVITSTYNGEPPDTALRFNEWMCSIGDSSLFGKVDFAVLGRGSSDWRATFHKFPRFVHESLVRLGAEPLVELAKIDVERGDEDKCWSTWCLEVSRAIDRRYKLGLDLGRARFDTRQARASVQFVEGPAQAMGIAKAQCCHITAIENIQGDALKVEMRLPKEQTFDAGDHVMLWPQNRREDVHRLLEQLGARGDSAILSTPWSQETSGPLTIADIVTHCLDLHGPASQSMLARLCDRLRARGDIKHADILALLVDDFSKDRCKTNLELFLRTQQRLGPTLGPQDWLSEWPPLSPRVFSIASGSDERGTVDILIGRDEENLGQMRSFFLPSVTRFPAEIRGQVVACSRFRPQCRGDIFMVATGTGIAPFIGFLQERRHRRLKGEQLSRARLAYGCRDDDALLCKQDLDGFLNEGDLDEVSHFSCAC